MGINAVGAVGGVCLVFPVPWLLALLMGGLLWHSTRRWNARADLVVAATALVAGLSLELLATGAGLWRYTHPSFAGVPAWVLTLWPLFMIGLPRLAQLLAPSETGALARWPASLTLGLGGLGLMFGLLATLARARPGVLALALAVLAGAVLLAAPSRRAVLMLLISAGFGAVCEALPVRLGIWSYPDADGLPVWLVPGYAVFGLAVVHLAHGLDGVLEERRSSAPRTPHAVFASLALLTAAFLNLQPSAKKVLGLPPPHGPSPLAIVALFCFTVAHARARLGARSLAFLMASTIVITFGMEALSISTGFVGAYEYTDKLGPMLGDVPLLIPAAWLMMLWPTLLVVETALGAEPMRALRDRAGTGRALVWAAAVSLLVGVAMTAWDVGVETLIAVTGEYTWKEKGDYFGIPIRNFVSWVGTSAAACFAFLAWETLRPARPPPGPAAPQWLPVTAYLVVFLVTFSGNFAHGNNAAALVTFFVMTPWLLMAAVKLLQRSRA